MIPSTYCVSKRHKVLWATMNFLAERDRCGIRTKKWDRPVIKETVDRRKLILEHNAADVFADVFDRQRNAVLDVYPSKRRMSEALQETREALEQAYWKVYLDTASSYGPWAARHLDATMKAPDPFRDPMVNWLRGNAASRVADINKTTRDRLQVILAEATEEGDSLQETASRIDDLFLDEIIPNRSMVIARTEVGNAANFAAHEAAQATGVPMEKTWNTLGDPFVRDIHADADGQTVEINQDFTVGGEFLGWPGDISKGASAGNVINCRCFLTYDV